MTILSAEDLRAIMRADFYSFMLRCFAELYGGAEFLHNWHIELLAAKLQATREGGIRRLIINIPPRHLKSLAASVALPAWCLGHAPDAAIVCAAYAQDLSEKFARDCRAVMHSGWYRATFPTRLTAQRAALGELITTKGGFRLATSVGGVLTGRGADLIIIDDPLKPADAISHTRRGGVNGWYDGTLYSRLNDKSHGVVIIVMQRLHEDDLVGHLLRQEGWELLSFPAIAEHGEEHLLDTPFGTRRFIRRAGEALHPARESLETLEQIRATIGDYNFASQYQQDPQPPSGLIVKREWLKFYSEEDKPDAFDQIVQSWDTASKVSQLSDYSVCTTWGLKGQKMYLLNVFRRKMEFPELKRTVRDLATLWHATVVLVEDKSSGIPLIQELHADGFASVKAAPANNGEKEMRLRAQTAKIEGHFALFPERAPWLDAYLLELTTFPNSKHDDQVDSTVHALAWSTQEATKSGMALFQLEKMRYEQRMQELQAKR
jgi:predicted phage terminase large subunit-like protein